MNYIVHSKLTSLHSKTDLKKKKKKKRNKKKQKQATTTKKRRKTKENYLEQTDG